MIKLSFILERIAKSLSVIDDQDDNSINILCNPINFYPQYITIKLSQNEYKLIKFKQCKQENKSYLDLSFSIIKMNKHYNQQFKRQYFEYQKNVNIDQLKQQLLYGQYNLDATTFEQLYETKINNYIYKNFKIYILSDKFNKKDVNEFIDKIYNIISFDIVKSNVSNIQFKEKLQNNHIAQISDKILEITDYNIHAFIHQVGHSIYYNLTSDYNKQIQIRYIYQQSIFPSQLSKQNIQDFFAQIFAFYFCNQKELTKQQISLIDYILYNKKLLKAHVKIYRNFNKNNKKNILTKRLKVINKFKTFIY